MKKINLLYLFILLSCTNVFAQQDIFVKANFNPEDNIVDINQQIKFTNTNNQSIDIIYLSDWNNSSSDKSSDFAERFADEFKTKLHFAPKKDVGYTNINSINSSGVNLKYERENTDLIKISLIEPLASQQSITLDINYQLQLPNTKFTRYGIDKKKNIALKEWFLVPGKLLNNEWECYSNKDLDDLYFPNSNLTLELTYPNNFSLNSDLIEKNNSTNDSTKTSILSDKNKISTEIHLTQKDEFTTLVTDNLTFITNIDGEEINVGLKAVIHDKIASFLTNKLGQYPFEKIILSDQAYRRNPVYGLNQLPNFIRPYPDGFQYEIKILKASISNFIKNTFNTNPRKDYWLNNALESYLMYKYVQENYPNMKVLGTLSRIWGIRSFELAKKKFNYQYDYTNQYMARLNLNQPITMQRDSLLKFNEQIANKNKAGLGLVYLEDYLDDDSIAESIKEFYGTEKLANIKSNDFIDFLKLSTSKNIDWFLPNYIDSNKTIDYTIKKAVVNNNQIELTVKNTTDNPVPFSVYQLVDKKVAHKEYFEGFTGIKTFNIPNRQAERLIINYEGIIPEINQRNNTKTIKPHLFNRPLKFSFLKDSEAPRHNQVFYTPQIGYNLYDGLSPGIRFSNRAILRKQFNYSIRPTYGMRSKTLIGSVKASYTHFFKNKSLFNISYGASYSRSHYEDNLMYRKFNPYLSFGFRKKNDLRSNFNQSIEISNTTIDRDLRADVDTDPNYSVYSLKHRISNRNLLNLYALTTNTQFAKDFGKISLTASYRKTFKGGRQINARVFAGTFLYNKTNSDYFSFALDRPTDYLFEYGYYGRSESTGIYSQQIIIAEGGFKSKLNTPLANDWITTLNLSTNIWKYIFAYGDIGALRNQGDSHFVYDSGIHLNLVPDYFELYFPIYSNLGWEISQPSYHEKIRFKVIIAPKALIGLFTRKWH